MCKKTVSLILAILMVLGCVSATAETSKQEKVYVVAGADGTVTSITDNIRLENTDSLETIADQTLLTGIENLSGDEAFTLEDGMLTWQANGKDIIYQGTSDKAPALVPVVTITLDGEAVSAAGLKEKEGEAVLTVTYQAHENVPALAVTAMLLPENGVSGLKTENASVVTEMGKQILVGYAVPCADAALKLPASFTASFHADHADLGWMMTVVSSDPIDLACKAIDEKADSDLHTELDEAAAVLSAMSRNETLPATDGKAKDIVQKLNELNDGLVKLDNGALLLANGAKALYGSAKDEVAGTEASGAIALSDGAAALDSGLAELTQNNEALNNGAAAIFAAILDTANKQLAASGLDAAGIALPALTAENYETVLDTASAQAKRAQAKGAEESLTALKAQLDQVSSFVNGVKAYTDGAAQAAEGAAKLDAGMIEMKSGAFLLVQGADTLYTNGTQLLKKSILDAEAELANTLLPYAQDTLPEALRIFETTRDAAQNAHYDLAPEGIRTTTLYLIRTDL